MSGANDNPAADLKRARAFRALHGWMKRNGSAAELKTLDLDPLTDEDIEIALCGTGQPAVVRIPHRGKVR